MNETLEYLQMFARFPFALRRFLKHTLTLEEARQIVRQRMEHREQNFLRLVEKSIYRYSRSPYLPLLKMAGCELGDLRALVQQKGVEGALRQLRDEGVYVTFEEFKGRKPIVRNGETFSAKPRDFDNPVTRKLYDVQTGGSSGAAASVGANLEHIMDRAPYELITYAAQGVLNIPSASWSGILPDLAISSLLRRIYIRNIPQRWFSHIGWHDSKSWVKYDLATYYMVLWMRLFGARVPLPQYVRVDQAITIARWVAETLRTSGPCVLHAPISRALRVCVAAQEAGLDIAGATFKGAGEPVTPAKVERIKSAGVRHISSYAMVEAGVVAAGCPQSAESNDVHLYKDAFALFTAPYSVPAFGVEVPAFNLTTLRSTAPKVLLNVQIDDYGIVEERTCGCELETYGYTTHLREIRSYSKLTGEGATLIGTEMVRILEEVLPARLGGTPLDYQLLEEEDDQGLTRLYLVISPRVQIEDEHAAIEVLLDALRQSSSMADAARTVWQQGATIKIKRVEPAWTGRGKFLPLHIIRLKQDS